jgi:hypothetical protein
MEQMDKRDLFKILTRFVAPMLFGFDLRIHKDNLNTQILILMLNNLTRYYNYLPKILVIIYTTFFIISNYASGPHSDSCE